MPTITNLPESFAPTRVWERYRNLDAMGCIGDQLTEVLPDGSELISQAIGKYGLTVISRGEIGLDLENHFRAVDNETGEVIAHGSGPYVVGVAEVLAYHFGPEFIA